MRKKKIIIAGAAALLALSMIGGTWAAWSQTLVAKNEYETAKYSTFLTEHFKEPENWEPGITEQKEIMVTNDSTIPIVAQVKMRQKWYRTEDRVITTYEQPEEGGEVVEKNVTVPAGTLNNTFKDDDNEEQYAAVWNFNGSAGEEVYVLESGTAKSKGLRPHYSDGEPLRTVAKPDEAGHWLLKSETPDEAGWFTFYFVGRIEAGSQSPKLLESVTMNPLLEATITGSETYYVAEKDGGYRQVTMNSVTSKYGEGLGGYDGCNYDIDVTMKTTQATAGGMQYTYDKEWDEITECIAGYIKDGLGYDGSDIPGQKKLWIVQQGRELAYVPTREVDGEDKLDPGNWFMSFTNMVPGETYTDTLKISNEASRSYTVYMRITPKAEGALDSDPDIEELKRELLEKIYMEVYYLDDDTAERLAAQPAAAAETDQPIEMKGTLLYKGTSTGIAQNYTGAAQDRPDYDTLRYLIPLGRYYRGDEGTIFVRLTLDPNIGLTDEQVKRSEETGEVIAPDYRYADLLTKVDWEFLIQQVPSGGPGGNPGGGPGSGTSTIISDNPPPLASFDEPEVPLGTMIPDEDVPLAFLAPVTGDETPIVPIMVTAAALLALMAVFGALAFGGKKKKEETT